MEKTIKNPFSVNHRIYKILLYISIAGIFIGCGGFFSLSSLLRDIIKNISFGCFASILVAWLLEIVNVRDKNEKSNIIYDSVYSELYFAIGRYIRVWSEICYTANRGKIKETDKYTWTVWYQLTKQYFMEETEERKKELMHFYVDQVSLAVQDVNKIITKIMSQDYILRINNIYNSAMERILEDYRFEFYAADLELKRDTNFDDFWNTMDVINKDIINYINAWDDIKYFNNLQYAAYSFMDDKKDMVLEYK